MSYTLITTDLIVAAISSARRQLGDRYPKVHRTERVADGAVTITYEDGTTHKIAVVETVAAPATAGG